MKVSTADVIAMFEALLSGSKSREEVASWADAVRVAGDEERLECAPQEHKIQIWEGIGYLAGVDLKVAPDTYLHVNEDFRRFFDEWRRACDADTS